MSKRVTKQDSEEAPLSQDDLIAMQAERLEQGGNVKFLQSLQPNSEKVFGIKNKPREEEPAMSKIFSWGYEAPVRNDYINDHREIKNKIRKMDKEYISEAKDNYRKPEYYKEKDVYLFNYMGKDNQEMWKKKIYDMTVEGESDALKKTMYQILYCGEERQWWSTVFSRVTPAGKPRTVIPASNVTVTPMEMIRQRIEEKIGEILKKDEVLAEHFI